MNSTGKPKIVVAVTGASGSIYAKVLLDILSKCKDQVQEVAVVFSKNAKMVWEHELGAPSYSDYGFKEYAADDFMAPFASGSARFNHMVICPCSMGTMARIAQGTSSDLITRAADVILKERRQLIIVPRDSPYNLIHIRNMEQLILAGANILPASPSFYSKPSSFEELAATICHRILDQIGLQIDSFRWSENPDEY